MKTQTKRHIRIAAGVLGFALLLGVAGSVEADRVALGPGMVMMALGLVMLGAATRSAR